MKLTTYLALACSLAIGCDDFDINDHRNGGVEEAESGAEDEGEDEGDPGEEEEEGGEEESGSETGSDTGDSDDSDGDIEPVGEPYAFAMRYGDLPDVDSGESGSDSGGGGDDEPWQDADALYVKIATTAKTCEDPFAAVPCGGHYSVSFILPPEIQAPGTYALFDEAFGGFTYAFEPYEEGDCGWGGGSLDGVLEIEHIDQDHVVGRLLDTDAFDFDANIEFDAPLCD